MQTFNPMQYLAINVANNYGLDKQLWEERIQWTKDHLSNLEDYADEADSKPQYVAAVAALRAVQAGKPTGYIMSLDATASGYQIMSALSGCVTSAKAVNLVNTGNREDIYTSIANKMSRLTGTTISRDTIKNPVMTTGYGSKAQPKEIFGEGEVYEYFLETLDTVLPGCMAVMDIIRCAWDNKAKAHKVTMPDGHVMLLKSTIMRDTRIDADELGHTFTYRYESAEPHDDGTNLIANVVHMVDGYIAREMVRRANKQGFQLAHIHDSFWASPKYMNNVRYNYKEILAEICETRLLVDIMYQLTGDPEYFQYEDEGLAKLIRKSNYALS